MQDDGTSPTLAKRPYDATGRRAAAAETRQRILDSAHQLFLADGYTATTVAAIAGHAGCAPDTVYASVGTKPVLFRELVETAIHGGAEPAPPADPAYVVAMRAADNLADKLAIYATAVTAMQERLAPLFLVLRDAAATDALLADVWMTITARRAKSIRDLATDLAASGELRTDLSLDEVADVVWTTNGSEYFALLVLERGWSTERFREWLEDSWYRLLVAGN